MNIPERAEAERLLQEGEALNPGGWADHSRYVALAARNIAEVHPELDAETAYILGLLHDIGRQDNVNDEQSTDLRHVLDGYAFLEAKRYGDAARICLTHSFPVQRLTVSEDRRSDFSAEERTFLERYLARITYSKYDRLLQLCDALALSSGFVLLEKRLLDVALRRGIHEATLDKWRKWFDLQRYFEKAIGRSVYNVLPGVVENTFGFKP